MSALILYGHVDSTNAIKIRFLLAELGQEVEHREIPLDGGRPASYSAIHPSRPDPRGHRAAGAAGGRRRPGPTHVRRRAGLTRRSRHTNHAFGKFGA